MSSRSFLRQRVIPENGMVKWRVLLKYGEKGILPYRVDLRVGKGDMQCDRELHQGETFGQPCASGRPRPVMARGKTGLRMYKAGAYDLLRKSTAAGSSALAPPAESQRLIQV